MPEHYALTITVNYDSGDEHEISYGHEPLTLSQVTTRLQAALNDADVSSIVAVLCKV